MVTIEKCKLAKAMNMVLEHGDTELISSMEAVLQANDESQLARLSVL